MTIESNKRSLQSSHEGSLPAHQQSNSVNSVGSVVTPRSKRLRTSSVKSQGHTSSHQLRSNANSSINQTPQKPSSGSLRNLTNKGLSESEGTSIRRGEKLVDVNERLVKNTDCVVDQAQPRDPKQLKLAQTLTEHISESIEQQISTVDSNTHDAEYSSDGDVFSDKPLPKQTSQYVDTFLPWTRLKDKKAMFLQTERSMYPMISAFILHVAQEIQSSGLVDTGSDLYRSRLILPFAKTDTRPGNSDSSEKIDIGLCYENFGSSIKLQDGMSYYSLFSIIEAKRGRSATESASAYAQLFAYSEKLYFYQINRRFLWGIVCCGSVVNACLFSNYNVHASPDIDVAKPSGRKEFVRLLVGWSLCEWNRLGYDQTITINNELGCYEVQVPKQDDPKEHTIYYCDDSVLAAEREFGRHCRCLLATPIRPESKVPNGAKLQHTVVIKDSWISYSHPKDDITEPIAQKTTEFVWPPEDFIPIEDARNEVRLLSKIKSGLSDVPDLQGRYPEIKDGGWVYQPLDTGLADIRSVIDSTREIVGGLDDEKKKDVPFCLHMRYAMTPIGRRLREVSSVPELLVVLYDAMQCHYEIHERCGILHRDISDNNILVVREPGKPIHGILIDYDCAIDKSVERSSVRPERTGTQPFMSIANLEGMDIDRTVLDDWESLLYLVCWLGTYGINKSNQRDDSDADIPIKRWRDGSSIKIALDKRNSLSSAKAFANQISSHFYTGQEGWEVLRMLAMQLHSKLFFNERLKRVEERCYGTWGNEIIDQNASFVHTSSILELAKMQVHSETTELNPFKERIDYAQEISKDLLDELARFATWARSEISS